ncbi:MAG: glutamine-hydrolyzing GMP synthase [Spirochaetota bacterium]
MGNTQEVVIVLDFGAQYSQLIARRVRENQVYSIIMPYNTPAEELRKLSPSGIILSGGPASVLQEDSPRPDPGLFELGVPILGICYGLQIMTVMLGGTVEQPSRREYGFAALQKRRESPLLSAVSSGISVWMSHGDAVSVLPEGFETTASTENSPVTVMENPKLRFYGVQFHPEVAHTEQGTAIIGSFVHDICYCGHSWSMESFVETAIEKIRHQVGNRTILCGLSGGVDSSVTAALLHRAVGDQLICVFVDNGLLRKGEADLVIQVFRDHFHIRLHHVDAEKRFLDPLSGVSDPEAKRKIIGREFIEVFEQASRDIGEQIDMLAQGTLYPDVIESVSASGGPSATIKSHHNVGGLPENLRFELIEPLRELFKDEVRELGEELGLPGDIVSRHPFPGPGLGIRCIGQVTKERLDTLREVDAIFIEEIRQAGLYDDIWQALACLLPVRSVGVQGDERTYEEVCSLRAVTSKDAMTADWYRFPPDLLQKISNRICNEVPRVNRVLYDITSKPPGTVEWE